MERFSRLREATDPTGLPAWPLQLHNDPLLLHHGLFNLHIYRLIRHRSVYAVH